MEDKQIMPPTPMNDDNDDDAGEDLNSDVLSILDGETKSPVYIDDLPDAIVDGKLVLREGDQIVIEKWLTIAQKVKWLGTSLYKIRRIDPLDDKGDLGLHDEELQQGAQANWKTGPKHGWRFKQAVPGLNLNRRSKPEFENTALLSTRAKEVAGQRVGQHAAPSGPATTEPGPKGVGGRPKGPRVVDPARQAAADAQKRAREQRREGRLERKAERQRASDARKKV